jgi:hypothetical protein
MATIYCDFGHCESASINRNCSNYSQTDPPLDRQHKSDSTIEDDGTFQTQCKTLYSNTQVRCLINVDARRSTVYERLLQMLIMTVMLQGQALAAATIVSVNGTSLNTDGDTLLPGTTLDLKPGYSTTLYVRCRTNFASDGLPNIHVFNKDHKSIRSLVTPNRLLGKRKYICQSYRDKIVKGDPDDYLTRVNVQLDPLNQQYALSEIGSSYYGLNSGDTRYGTLLMPGTSLIYSVGYNAERFVYDVSTGIISIVSTALTSTMLTSVSYFRSWTAPTNDMLLLVDNSYLNWITSVNLVRLVSYNHYTCCWYITACMHEKSRPRVHISESNSRTTVKSSQGIPGDMLVVLATVTWSVPWTTITDFPNFNLLLFTKYAPAYSDNMAVVVKDTHAIAGSYYTGSYHAYQHTMVNLVGDYSYDISTSVRDILLYFNTVNLITGTSSDMAASFYLRVTACQTIDGTTGFCTACPSDGNTYLASATDYICKPVSEITNGYGMNRTTFVVDRCVDMDCLRCTLDNSICIECKPSSMMKDNKCYGLSRAVPAGFGLQVPSVSNQTYLSTCTVSFCQVCNTNRAQCNRCNPGYALVDPVTCIQLSTVTISSTSNKGKNMTSGMYETCVEPNCVDCRDDITVCLFCKLGTVLWQGKCLTTSNYPDGYGPASVTYFSYTGQYFAKCSTLFCGKCTAGVAICEQCAITPTNQTILHLSSCVFAYTLPLGYGANLVTNKSTACSQTNCADCAMDYTMCRICNSVIMPRVYNHFNNCIPVTSIPDGYGAFAAKNEVKACSMPHCLKCANDYTICTVCDTSGPTPFFMYASACLVSFELPAYYGGNIATGIAVACQDANCQYCRADYTLCTACNPSIGRYLYNSQCLATASLPDTYGAYSGNFTSRKCYIANCNKCQSDWASGCTECIWGTSPQTYFYSSDCYLPSELPDGYGARVGVQPPIAAICSQNTQCSKCQADNTKCTACKAGYYLYNLICYSASGLPDGYGAGTTRVAMRCLDTNCKKCQSDYKICTQCFNTPTVSYIHVANSSCLLPNQIPNGYGAKIVSGYGETAACTVPLCLACQTDYQTCGTCSPNNPPNWVYTNACTLESSLPNGYGGNAATGAAVPCSSSLCLKCQPNYMNCTQCKTQIPELYLMESTGQCLTAALLPDGYGPDTVKKKALPCTTTNCTNCRSGLSTCSSCNSTGPYPNYLLLGSCYQHFNLPQYYGGDNTSYVALPCAINRCLNCSRDPTDCQQCITQTPELYLHLNGASHQCLMSSELPDGYGADQNSLTSRVCSKPGCQQCKVSFKDCTSCNTSIVPLIYFHQGSCRVWQDLPDPFGANPVTRIATPCESDRCTRCKNDFTFCDSCQTANPQTFRYPNNGTCMLNIEIGESWGPNLITYELQACLDANCRVCNENYQECKFCYPGSQTEPLYMFNGKCLRLQDIPAKHGCDNSTLLVKPCDSLGCKDCLYNYKVCVKCDDPPASPTLSNPKYFFLEYYCTPCTVSPLRVIDHVCNRLPCDGNACIITLKATRFFKTKLQLKGQFSGNIVLNKSASYKISIVDPESNINRDLQKHEYDITIVKDVLLISLDIDQSQVKGTIQFDRVDKEEHPIRGDGNTKVFFDYPITWDSIFILKSSAQASLSNAASTTTASTASAKAIAQLVIITKSSNIAKIPDMMVSNMVYLQMMNGETYLYPTMVFDFFGNSQLPFVTLKNPFDPSLRSPECLVAPKMYEKEMDCGILPNYGIDVLITYITLAINILVSLIHYGLYGARLKLFKKHKDKVNVEKMEKTLGYKISSFINESYGMKMSLVKLDGTVVEVMFYSAMTISSQPIVSVKYLYSVLVSFAFIGYYVWSMYSYIRLIIYITPGLERIRAIEDDRKKVEGSRYQPHEMSHYIDFTRVKYGLVGYQIEDYRSNIPFIYMLAPVVWFLRCVIINIFLIGGTNMKSGQYYVYIMIESAYLYYLVKSQVKASRFENWLSYFNEGSQIVYILLQVISYHSSDTDFKQKQIGLMQAGILALIMVINIGYTFVVFIWQVIIKPIVRRCKKDPVKEKARINEEQLRGEKLEGQESISNDKSKKQVVSTFRQILQNGGFVKKPSLFKPEPMKPTSETDTLLKRKGKMLLR